MIDFTLDGKDYSLAEWVLGYSVKTRKVTGQSAGYLLNGEHVADVIALKKDVTFKLSAMEQAELSAFLTGCTKEYVTMTFNDPISNTNVSGTFEPEISQLEMAIEKNSKGKKYWYEFTVTFTMK